MKNRLLYHLIIVLLRLTASLPLSILYLISSGMYVVIYRILRYRKHTVEQNLQRSFPEKSRQERKDIERKFYQHLCDCIVETIKLLNISDKEIDRRVDVTNGELIEQLANDGNPVILYMGHYANWEWVQAVTRHYARPAISGQIYRPLHNPVMEQVMLTIRSRFDTLSIPQKRAFRTLLKMKNEGKQSIIAFIADQRPNSGNLYHWISFLNQDTAYNTGGEEIGSRTSAHYAYLDIEKVKRGYYRMTFCAIAPMHEEKQYPYTRQFMALMESTIRRAPQYWLWSHKRWRFGRSTENDKN